MNVIHAWDIQGGWPENGSSPAEARPLYRKLVPRDRVRWNPTDADSVPVVTRWQNSSVYGFAISLAGTVPWLGSGASSAGPNRNG